MVSSNTQIITFHQLKLLAKSKLGDFRPRSGKPRALFKSVHVILVSLVTLVVTAAGMAQILQPRVHYQRVAEGTGGDALADGRNAESNCGAGDGLALGVGILSSTANLGRCRAQDFCDYRRSRLKILSSRMWRPVALPPQGVRPWLFVVRRFETSLTRGPNYTFGSGAPLSSSFGRSRL